MLAVTGIGMVTALGLDAPTSCAAARAGLRRAGALEELLVFDEEADALAPVVGHRVPVIAAGLFGGPRLLQLGLAAIEDVRRSAEPPPNEVSGFVLAAPSGLHRQSWLDALRRAPSLAEEADMDDASIEAAERSLWTYRDYVGKKLAAELVKRGKVNTDPAITQVVAGDQVGFVDALGVAARFIANGQCASCWVGGVDSYLDPETLSALDGLGVLRTPDNPVGFMPGEAAVFLLVEDSRTPSRFGRKTKAVIESFGQVTGARARFGEGDPPDGRALVSAMSMVGGAEPARWPDLFLINLNGDEARAAEWGNALYATTLSGLRKDTPTWIPPLYFGEIGAATGPAGVALLAQGWARSYAPSKAAITGLLGDGNARGALRTRSA